MTTTDTPSAPALPPVTWLHVSHVTDVAVGKLTFPRHVVRLNNRGVAYLYNTRSTTPVRRIEGAVLTLSGQTAKVTGHNTASGSDETWLHDTRVGTRMRSCGSCG